MARDTRRGRNLMLAGAAGRGAYGLGCMFAPEWMHHAAPDIRGHPDGRMNLRGFGGAHTAIAAFTAYAAAREPRLMRPALGLNLLCDALDGMVSFLEVRDRGGVDLMGGGGIAFNVTGLSVWSAALRRLG